MRTLGPLRGTRGHTGSWRLRRGCRHPRSTTVARGHQGLQAAGGERARDRAHTLTSESQAPDRELPPLWPEAPGLWSRAGPTPPLTTAPDTPGPSRSREAQPGKDGRVSFSCVFMKRSHGSHGQRSFSFVTLKEQCVTETIWMVFVAKSL